MIEILDIRDKTEEDSKEHEECVQPEWKERLLDVFLGVGAAGQHRGISRLLI